MATEKMREAEKLVADADKMMKGGFFRKPDPEGASINYDKAATTFRNLKSFDAAIAAYKKAAQAHLKNDVPYSAARQLENAATVARDSVKSPVQAAELFKEAAMYYLQDGNADKAAEVMTRAAKTLEATDPGRAIELFSDALQQFEDDDKQIYAVQAYKAALGCALKARRWDDSIALLKRSAKAYTKLDRLHELLKLGLSMVVVHLCRSDYVAADAAFQEAARDYAGFVQSSEGKAATALLDAYEHSAQDDLVRATRLQTFDFLEPEITRLARALVAGGDLAASPAPAGPAAATASPAAARGVGGRDAGAAQRAPSRPGEDDARASLFGRGAAAAKPRVASPPAQAAAPRSPAPAPAAHAASPVVPAKVASPPAKPLAQPARPAASGPTNPFEDDAVPAKSSPAPRSPEARARAAPAAASAAAVAAAAEPAKTNPFEGDEVAPAAKASQAPRSPVAPAKYNPFEDEEPAPAAKAAAPAPKSPVAPAKSNPFEDEEPAPAPAPATVPARGVTSPKSPGSVKTNPFEDEEEEAPAVAAAVKSSPSAVRSPAAPAKTNPFDDEEQAPAAAKPAPKSPEPVKTNPFDDDGVPVSKPVAAAVASKPAQAQPASTNPFDDEEPAPKPAAAAAAAAPAPAPQSTNPFDDEDGLL
eukprot:m51a1_g11102 hypothetical protein (647) ;mRNA; r:52416-54860